jgi:uroporphyrinogen decarboxylase
MQKVIRHEKPDRTPTMWGARPEADRAIMRHFGTVNLQDALAQLGIEGWGGCGEVNVEFPEFDRQANGTLEGDFPHAGSRMILHDENTFEDRWGVVRRVGTDRMYVEWVSGPLQDAESVEEYDFPGPERVVHDPDRAERVRRRKQEGLWISYGIGQPFRDAWFLRGLENFLADYYLNPGFVEALYEKMYRLETALAREATTAGVDELHICGDVAMQDRLLMGPEMWRRFDKPVLARIITDCRAINPDLVISMHSDGNMMEIVEDLLEIGLNILDPIQPECMDPFEVKKRFGDRLTLQGCGSLQKTLPFGTPEDCREEVRQLIRKCGYDGGLILRVANAIGPDVPVANIVAWFEEARDFDMASL